MFMYIIDMVSADDERREKDLSVVSHERAFWSESVTKVTHCWLLLLLAALLLYHNMYLPSSLFVYLSRYVSISMLYGTKPCDFSLSATNYEWILSPVHESLRRYWHHRLED